MKLAQKAQLMSSYMLSMRRTQDLAESVFIQSLGGLSLPQLKVLNVIGDFAPCTMTDIAKHTVLSLSSVTLIVDKLVKSLLVDRARSDVDRRIVYATLTEAGQEIYQVQIQHLNAISNKLLNILDEHEQDMFLHILKKITQSTPITQETEG